MTKDQEIDAILVSHNRQLCPSDREVLELCDATRDYPWRTVRSKVSRARLFIEIKGKWQIPEYMLPSEAILATYPQLTEQEMEEMTEALGF